MDYLGIRSAGSTVCVYVTTHAQTGAAAAPLSAFEVGDFILYKNGSATQRSSTSGWAITSPFDSIVGLHLLTIDLSDNTDAGFYSSNASYTVVLSPDETVDGLAVVKAVAAFDIGAVQTGDTFARLGAPAGASVSADIAAVLTKVRITLGRMLPWLQ